MNLDEFALVWLNQQGIGFLKAEKIFNKFDKIEDIFNQNKVKNAIFEFVGAEKLKESLLKLNINEEKERIENELNFFGIDVITFVSNGYPEKLKTISDPPLVLYFKGDISLLSKKSISIVGTRKPTEYGRITCEKFVSELVSAGLVTVSGLAYGIDTVVAESTLSAGGKVIAVLGGGLDEIYPAQNKGLAKKIERSGLLLSEYKPKIRPEKYYFLERNRIVSALGLGTLIIEAGEHSGTMATARFALEQSRELFAIPGNINSPESFGTNALIEEMPEIFTISPDSIISKLGLKKKEEKTQNQQLSFEENQILLAIESSGTDFDTICEKTKISTGELTSILIKMEMKGLLKSSSSNIYYKI
ncbi:MAG: DNA-processing protein DprA [Clostridia bacterium]|nr:DNA-processing protein DprA [Clostridia bacterium]